MNDPVQVMTVETLEATAQTAADQLIEIINQFNLKYPDPEARGGMPPVAGNVHGALVSELLLFLAEHFVIAPPSAEKSFHD